MFQSSTASILPIVNPSTQNSKLSGYNWKTWAKAGLVFAATAGTFFALKATGSFSLISWLRNNLNELTENKRVEETDNFVALGQIETSQRQIVQYDTDKDIQEFSGLTDFKNLPLHDFQKRSDIGFPAILEISSLNGTNGFILNGKKTSDFYGNSGNSVSGAGDINGDGLDDLIVIYPNFVSSDRTGICIVFGHNGNWPNKFELSSLDGSNGFELIGAVKNYMGVSVSGAGDVNSDGIDDLVVGDTSSLDLSTGGWPRDYIVFGHTGSWPSSIQLLSLDGTAGFKLDARETSCFGFSVSEAGDINGDEMDDFIVGGSPYSYVIFGHKCGWSEMLELSTLDGSNGFRLDDTEKGRCGSISGAGDINGDNIADLIVGAPYPDAGCSYVVFGRSSSWPRVLELSTLDGNNGFRLNGEAVGDYSGCSVSGAGDINGDGVDDLIIGAKNASPSGKTAAGRSYLIFGHRGSWPRALELSTLDGSNGVKINGIDKNGVCGGSVSGAGDINGDGLDDLIIGDSTGCSIIFGHRGNWPEVLELSHLNGNNGFKVKYRKFGAITYGIVSEAGDINGDGVDDFIIGDPDCGINDASCSYVVFGQSSPHISSSDISSTTQQSSTDSSSVASIISSSSLSTRNSYNSIAKSSSSNSLFNSSETLSSTAISSEVQSSSSSESQSNSKLGSKQSSWQNFSSDVSNSDTNDENLSHSSQKTFPRGMIFVVGVIGGVLICGIIVGGTSCWIYHRKKDVELDRKSLTKPLLDPELPPIPIVDLRKPASTDTEDEFYQRRYKKYAGKYAKEIFEIRIERVGAENLCDFYKHMLLKLTDFCRSVKAVAGGQTKPKGGDLSKAVVVIDLLGDTMHITLSAIVGGITGKVVHTILKWVIGKPISVINEKRQTNIMKKLSKKIGFIPNPELEKVARELTCCYASQIMCLATELESGKRVAINKKLLNYNALKPSEKFAEFCVTLMLKALEKDLINDKDPLNSQLVNIVTMQQHVTQGIIEGIKQNIFDRLWIGKVKIISGSDWNLDEICSKCGVRTKEGIYYAGSGTKPGQYGYCDGTSEMAHARRLELIETELQVVPTSARIVQDDKGYEAGDDSDEASSALKREKKCSAGTKPNPKNDLLLQLTLWLSSIKFDSSAKRRNRFGLQPNSFTYVVGNCLFEAIAAQIGSTGVNMRAKAIEQIQQDTNLQRRISDLARHQNTTIRTIKGDIIYNSVDEYIFYMRQDQTWGTELEATALSLYLQRPIVILHPDDEFAWVIEQPNYAHCDPIFVEFQGKNHYAPLVVPNNPREILEQIRSAIAQRNQIEGPRSELMDPKNGSNIKNLPQATYSSVSGENTHQSIEESTQSVATSLAEELSSVGVFKTSKEEKPTLHKPGCDDEKSDESSHNNSPQ